MSTTLGIVLAVFVLGLLLAFLFIPWRQMPQTAVPRRSPLAAAPHSVPDVAAMTPMTVLAAVDDSTGSVAALEMLAGRPWPPGSRIEIFTAVHTNVPFVPDIFLGGVAAHVEALEEDRAGAPVRLRAARDRLTGVTGVELIDRAVEGAPAATIVAEADRIGADLIVIGAHGHGHAAGKHGVGSVAAKVVHDARCSVEIVRPSTVWPPGLSRARPGPA